MAYALLAGGLAIILASCEFFTNGVEWVGKRLKLSEGAVGSVLAAVGTALPETMVPLVAIAMGGDVGHEVAIGAILGAPFMLGTLGFMMVGVAGVVYARRGRRAHDVDLRGEVIRRDLRYFLLGYPVAIAAAFLAWHAVKVALAAALMVWYVHYVLVYLRAPAPAEEVELAPLYGWRLVAKGPPPTAVAVAQVLVAIGGIIAGARIFVDGVDRVAQGAGMSRELLALLIAPVATELPEKFNSVIWMRRGRDTLALGNMTGAMVFQSCFPVAVGLCLTPWRLLPWEQHWPSLMSVVLALGSGAWLWVWLRWRPRPPATFFVGAGSLYLLFALVIVATH